ncbi:hypothetical protein OQA88_2575 [Cercophora sp. LCS_1]
MRLLERDGDGQFHLTPDLPNHMLPPYAILSHVWGPEEVTFKDMVDGTARNKAGYAKIQFCGDQAWKDQVQHFWVDTCCIDKTNSTELQTAINSMFRWYSNATRCYVYLTDIPVPGIGTDEESESSWEPAFRAHKWFTRGWTLQELLAPKSVVFYAQDGRYLGDKRSLEVQIHEATGIAILALRGGDLGQFGTEARFSWAETRQTTVEEDWAYSLLGIFGVFMPLIYGEGKYNAIRRLEQEVNDASTRGDGTTRSDLHPLREHRPLARLTVSVNEISIRTAVAGIRENTRLRVYVTAVDGGIREIQFEDSTGWTGGTSHNVIAKGKIGTPIAATSLGLRNIRVYYITTGNHLGEAAWDGEGWYNGVLSKRSYDVAPYSSVSAVFLGGTTNLRVYAQLTNDTIQEWTCDSGNGWQVGTNLGPALPGTQIAATTWATDTIHIRVYAQAQNLDIFEECWDGSGWYTGGLSFHSPVMRAALAVTLRDGEKLVPRIRLYYGAPNNVIKETCSDGNGWYDGDFIQNSIPASNVAALDGQRVYLQNGTGYTAVTEYVWGSRGWQLGKAALPPA